MVRTVNHCYRNHSTSPPLSLSHTHTQCLSLSPWVQNTDLNHQQISAHSVKHQQHLKLRNYLDLMKKIYNKKKSADIFFNSPPVCDAGATEPSRKVGSVQILHLNTRDLMDLRLLTSTHRPKSLKMDFYSYIFYIEHPKRTDSG